MSNLATIDELGVMIQSYLHTVKVKPAFRQAHDMNALAGTCYVASEAYYHLAPDTVVLQPRRIKMPDGNTHWFLAQWIDKRWQYVDLTWQQYGYEDTLDNLIFLEEHQGLGEKSPMIKSCSFLTKQPSKRAQLLMNLVLGDIV